MACCPGQGIFHQRKHPGNFLPVNGVGTNHCSTKKPDSPFFLRFSDPEDTSATTQTHANFFAPVTHPNTVCPKSNFSLESTYTHGAPQTRRTEQSRDSAASGLRSRTEVGDARTGGFQAVVVSGTVLNGIWSPGVEGLARKKLERL